MMKEKCIRGKVARLLCLLVISLFVTLAFSGQAKAAEPTIKVAGTLLSAENPEKKVGDLHFTYDATYKRLTIGGQLAETDANATEGLVELDGVKDLTIYLEKDTSIVTNRSVGFLFMGTTDITISSGQNVSLSMNVKEQQWAYMFGGVCSKLIFKNTDLTVSVVRTGTTMSTSGSGIDMIYSSVSFVNADVSIECKGSDYDQALIMRDSDSTNYGYEKIMPSTVSFDKCKLSDQWYWRYITDQKIGYFMNTGYGTMATSAKVEKLPRKVSFHVNGVTVSAPSTQEVKEGEKATQPDITPPDGYQFDGWYLEPECVNKYDFSKPVMDDLTLYALWSFEVLFDGNGVTMVKAPAVQKIKRNAVAIRPEDPVAKGYLFDGWYQDPEGVYPFDFGEKITKRTVVIAKWTVHEHVMTKVPAKEATTTETGNAEYYCCSGCGRWYTDQEGLDEIKDHTKVLTPKKEDPSGSGSQTPGSGTVTPGDGLVTPGSGTGDRTAADLSAPKLSSAKNSKKKAIVLKWKKVSGAKGYEIQYSTNKNFKKGVKTKTTKKVKYTIKSLKKKKTYYLRVRAYKTDASGKKVFGKWSKAKKVKVKK